MSSVSAGMEHAYSSYSRPGSSIASGSDAAATPGGGARRTPQQHHHHHHNQRKTPLQPRVGVVESPAVRLSEYTRASLDELMMEGDLLEVRTMTSYENCSCYDDEATCFV